MKALGEDWYTVGDTHFRTVNLFDMSWGSGFSLSRFHIALCEFSGHIAFLLDGQPGCKPVIQIFTSAGKLVSQKMWKDAPPLTISWSTKEELLVVQKTGFTTVIDLFGNYVRRFSMGHEAEEREIKEAKFFKQHNHTGIAVLTGANHLFFTTTVDTPRIKRLAQLPHPSQSISLWEIIPGSSDSGNNPWSFVARKDSLYRIGASTVEQVDLLGLTRAPVTPIRSLVVTSDATLIAIYFESGKLILADIRMTEIRSQIDLNQCISCMLRIPDCAPHSVLNHPRTLVWCTDRAVVLQWDHVLALISNEADVYESFYPDDVHLTQEMDCVRVLTPTRLQLIQPVPKPLESIGRIGSSSPANWLLCASNSMKSESGRTNDYLLPIRTVEQMVDAISNCIEAAGHAVLDPYNQKSLLEAAHMGRIFLSATFTNQNDPSLSDKLAELAEYAAQVSQLLRLLNNLAVPWIGIALTWQQFRNIGPTELTERLLTRNYYPLALHVIRVFSDKVDDRMVASETRSDIKGDTVSRRGLARLLAHWACNSKIGASEDSNKIAAALRTIVERIAKSSDSSYKWPDNASLALIGSRAGVDFAEVANQTLVAGREKMAEQLIEYESRAWHQVRLLLKLGRESRALARAVETGDPELITMVVASLQDQAKLPPADLAMKLRRHPIALAIYQETWGQSQDPSQTNVGTTGESPNINAAHKAILSFAQEDDRTFDAKKLVILGYNETNLAMRISSLQKAEELYKQARNEFMAQECNAAVRLLNFQGKLEKQSVQAPMIEPLSGSSLIVPPISMPEEGWVGQTLNDTLFRLLSSPQCERHAEQLRREFRVSEKRFAHLRLIGMAIQNNCWTEIDKMIKSKKLPVNVETIIKVCIDCEQTESAIKFISRLPVEKRSRFLFLTGQIEEAIDLAERERSEFDLRFIQERVSRDNRAVHERLSTLLHQL